MRRLEKLLALCCAGAVLATAGVAAPGALAANGHATRGHGSHHHTTTQAASQSSQAAGNAVINDCQANGQLTHSYTKAELRHALAVMSAATKQYTSCYDVINTALIKGVSVSKTGKGSGGSGGSFLPTWLIVVIIVLILAAVTFGGLAVRRRRALRDGLHGDGDPTHPTGITEVHDPGQPGEDRQGGGPEP